MPDQSSAATEHSIIQEINRPLETLPDDPMEIVNAEFPTALRGYDRLAVDEYVRHTRQLVAELQATRSPEAAVRRALEKVGEQIGGILKRAHETAEQITAQSRSEAEDRLEQARQEAHQIISEAERRVQDLDADTDRIWLERQRIVADAEDLAAQLQAVARTAAERFPEDASEEVPAPPAAAAQTWAEAEPAGVIGPDAELAAPHGVEPADEPEAEPVVPFDGETTAETTEHPMYGVEEGEDADFFGGAQEAAPGRSEVEQTMAFRPITPRDADAGEPEPGLGPDDPEAPIGESSPPPAGDLDDPDATQVIRPSSQAAHRRHDS